MTVPASQTCRSIMTTTPAVLKSGDTIETALHRLLEDKLLALPVVDEAERYLGMFLRSRLVALLLPKIVALEGQIPEIARLVEVGFMSDTLDDANERFRAVAGEPVSEYLETEGQVLHPETPVMNAVLFLYRTRTYLPVVEKASGRLLGVVSTWDILQRIARPPAR
ncbi:MAG: CBS domain-containing protein [Rhodospirillales bacterium]|nr:CBS domain-containing protein [Rhodospirillales bacterium]